MCVQIGNDVSGPSCSKSMMNIYPRPALRLPNTTNPNSSTPERAGPAGVTHDVI